MTSRAEIEGLFAALRRGKDLDPDGTLSWGYYFVDPDPARLQAAADVLTGAGYEFVEIFQDREDEESGRWRLQVVKAERHTADSLEGRNAQLAGFAARHGLAGFDGNDVGPAG